MLRLATYNAKPIDAAAKPPCSARKKREYLEHVLQRHLDAAEALIAEIDEIDGDWDLEPSLGSLAMGPCRGDQRRWAEGAADGREEVCEDEGANTGDDEPWLGRRETGFGATQGFNAESGPGQVFDGEVLDNPELSFA